MKLDSNFLYSSSSNSFISKQQLPLFKLKLFTIHENKVKESIPSRSNGSTEIIPHLEFDWNVSNTCRDGHLFDLPLQLKYIQPRYYNASTSKRTSTMNDKCKSQTEIIFATGTTNILSTQHQYKFQALFTRYLSQFSIFSTGIQMDSFRGLSWLFKWQRGDVCINVPIQMTSIILGGGSRSSGSRFDNMLYCVSSTYIGFLSFVIDAVVGDVVRRGMNRVMMVGEGASKNGNTDSSSNKNNQKHRGNNTEEKEEDILTSSFSIQKEKKDAELQMQLMKRKAIINKRNEEEKGGLVIVEAKYGVKGGESMDVSIQLQFWVSDSRLLLTSNSKSHMLGFYDVTKGSQVASPSSFPIGTTNDEINSATKNDGHKHITASKRLHLFGLFALWDSLCSHNDSVDRKLEKDNKVAFLMIRYKFNGILYEICVLDNEAVSLPSPRAMKVAEET